MASKNTSEVAWAREYETTYILRPTVDPDEADRIGKRLAEVIERFEGRLTKVDIWGKRRLAYPIGKRSYGVFIHLRYLGYTTLVAELERNLRMFDDVMRYLTVKVRDRVNPSEVDVSPEEVEFQRIEVTPDEEEVGLEQRLGMAPARERESAAEGADEEAREFADEEDESVAEVAEVQSAEAREGESYGA